MSSRNPLSSRQHESQPQRRGTTDGQKDIWADNLHLKHPESDLEKRVQSHNQTISSDDKFIDYVRHIDN